MQIRKLCQACEAEPGLITCRKCGRLVGKNCRRNALCKDCNTGPS